MRCNKTGLQPASKLLEQEKDLKLKRGELRFLEITSKNAHVKKMFYTICKHAIKLRIKLN